MPLSDNLRYFLQHVGMTPEQQAQERQQQAILAAHQSQFGQQQDFARQKMQQDAEEAFLKAQTGLVPYGFNMQRGRGGAGPATQQGGDGLNATTPSTMEAPGSPTPRGDGPPQPSTDELMEKLMPGWGQFQGQQQQGGMGVNQPGQMPQGGPMTPSMRMPGMSGDSGGGGAAQPAAAKPVVPTMQSILQGQFRGQPYNISKMPSSGEEDPEMNLPADVAKIHGSPKAKASQIKLMAPIWDTILRGQQASAKPGKDDKDAPIMDTAVRDFARANPDIKLPKIGADEYYDLSHVPEEKRAAVQQAFGDLKTPGAREAREASTAQKKSSDQELKNKIEQFNTQKANAEGLLAQTQADPKAFFQKGVSQEARDQATALAHQRGIDLPTRDLPEERAKVDLYSMDLIQGNNRLKQLATQLGPDNLGALMGRWNEGQMTWGTPLKTGDPRIDAAAQEFYSIANGLTIREVKQLGGGRAAVQLMNTLKNATPQLKMDPRYMKGAFDAVDFWSNTQMKNNRDYMMGKLNPNQHHKGDIITIKGKKVRIGTEPDAKGNFDPDPSYKGE